MPAGVKCIYCKGSTSGVRKGEHIIPEALGCTLKLRCVCNECNSNFSILDKELCSKSPLSIVVQQELGTESTTNWDYNEQYDIALEAKILPGFKSPMLWPQLVLLDKKVYFHFDQDEAEEVGIEDYTQAFHNLVQRSIEQWHNKNKGIIWERIRRHPDRGRFPPRFFCRHEYGNWKRGMTFICRYFDPIDQEQIVHIVSGWKPVITRSTVSTSLGVVNPEGFHTYERELVLRGLVKIGLNLLAHIHSHNAVNSDTFPMSIKYARLGTELTLDLNSNGFITNNTLQASNCPTKAHKFELSYLDNQWRFIAVFLEV